MTSKPKAFDSCDVIEITDSLAQVSTDHLHLSVTVETFAMYADSC